MDFRSKIRSIQDVQRLTDGKSVIMLAGTFDLVHVGHIRHMMYAKEKAELMVVNVTCDAHIRKGNTRPYVPEDLRALNLAALEMVDYVVIDTNPTPIQNISILQPKYFAKGQEYGVLTPKTQEEKQTVERYGGEMLFTPGDIVYSSTEILKQSPHLWLDKLLALMSAEGISFGDLKIALECIKGLKVHVVGDTIVDSYSYGTVIGGMTKSPTISVKFERRDDYVGGAGVVAKHLVAAGASVDFTTVLGSDNLAAFVDSDLTNAGVRVKAFQDGRITTNKNAIVAEGYRLLKVDKVDNRTINEDALGKILHRIATVDTDIVIFSDFRHGIFNGQTIQGLTQAIPDKTFKSADSQVASRWGNILDFQGFDLITPNEREARFSLGDQDTVVRPLGLDLYRQASCKTLILKCGSDGILTVRSDDNTDLRGSFAIDSFCSNVVDAVGAGDALLAYSSLILKSTGNAVMASILGNISAGLECEQEGNIPIGHQMVMDKLNQIEKMANYESC